MHKSIFLNQLNNESLNHAKKLNLESIFVDSARINKNAVSLTREHLSDTKIFAHVSIFSDESILSRYPGATPIEAESQVKEKDSYAHLCPTHPKVREAALEKIKNLLKEDIDGIWLHRCDYPTKWDVPEPEILDTCYCDRCLKMFEEYIEEPIEGVGGEGSELENIALHIDGSYYHEWLEFKAAQIMSFVKEVRELIDIANKERSDTKKIQLGYFAIPWEDKEHGAAIKRIVAQDFGKLAQVIDVFSPMLYHKMCGKDVTWIKEKVEYFWNVGTPFLPFIQTEPKTSEISTAEFKQALEYAVIKPSMGICVFFLEDLVKQPEKFETLIKFFQ